MDQVRLVPERTGFHEKPSMCSTHDSTPTNMGILGDALLGVIQAVRMPSQGR